MRLGETLAGLRLGGALRLARGSVLAQLVTLAAVPVLARLFPAEAFGLFGFVSTAAAALSVAVTLRYDQGILPARHSGEAAACAILALLAAAGFALVLELGLLAAGAHLDAWSRLGGLAAVAWLLPISMAIQAFTLVGVQWGLRQHRDSAVAGLYLVRAAVMTGLQVVGGLLGGGAAALLGGQVLGALAGLLALRMRVGPPRLDAGAGPPVAQLREAAWAQRHLALFGAPRMMLEATGKIAMIGLISVLFGPRDAGLYWMAVRVLAVPAAFADEPVRQATFRATAEARRSGEAASRPVVLAVVALGLGSLLGIGILHLAGDQLVAIVLGEQWAAVGPYLRLLSICAAAGMTSIPLSGLAVVLGCQRQHLGFEVVLQAGRLGCLGLGYWEGSFLLALQALAVLETLYVALLAWFLLRREASTQRPPALLPGAEASAAANTDWS
jgi:O-antigen/teichoic acid export membrane protein